MAPRANTIERVLGVGRTLHALEHARAAVLEGNVEVGQDATLGHQRHDLVDVRIRIHVVHADPDPETAQASCKLDEARFDFAATPTRLGITQVRAVGTGVLRYHQQLAHTGFDEAFGFTQYIVDAATRELAAQIGNDAETALVVAAFGNFEIRIMSRREPDTLRRHEIDEGVVLGRQMLVHRRDDVVVGVRPRYFEHTRMSVEDALRIGTETAGDDDLAVLLDGFADGIE